MGTLYLIHLDSPLGNPAKPHGTGQHYLGSTVDLERRLREHRAARPDSQKPSSMFLAHANARGIHWQVVRTWEVADTDLRQAEIRLKRQKKSRRLCPVCNGSRTSPA